MTNPFVGNEVKRDTVPNPFVGNTLREEQARERGALDTSTTAARGLDAAKLAEAETLSRRTNLPWGTVYRNLDDVRRMAGDRDFKPDEFVREYPQTARWLSDQLNAGVAKGDWARMGTIERWLGANWRLMQVGPITVPVPSTGGLLLREAARGQAGLELARLNFYSTPSERALLADELTRLRGLANAELPEAEGYVERGVRGMFRNVIPSMLSVGEEAAAGAVVGGGIGLAGGPAGIVTAPAGAALGASAGAFKRAVELIGGQAIDDFSQIRDDNGQPLDPMVADVAGRTVGVIGALPEVMGFGALTAPLRTQASRMLASGTARAMARPTTMAAIRAGARDWASAMGTEVSTEVIQQGIQLAGERVAREVAASDQPFSETAIPYERFREELTTTAIETALSTFLIGGAGGVTTTVGEMARVNEARETSQRFAALAENTQASELLKRSPEKYREWFNQATQDGPVRSAMMPVEAFTALWQGKNIDPMLAATELEAVASYQQALATGGDVVMPMAPFAEKVAGNPEYFDAALPDLRTRPGAMTMREAEAAEKALEADTEKLRKELTTAKPENDSEQRVVDDVVAQLTNAAQSMPAKTRYTPEQIATQAEAIASVFLTMARRTEQDAFELYQSRKIRMVGPADAEGMFETMMAVDRAERRGASVEEVAALRSRLFKVTEGRRALRDVLKEEAVAAKQTEGAVDDKGRLQRALSTVETDALVVEYIARRDQLVAAQEQLVGLEEAASDEASTEGAPNLMAFVTQAPSAEDAFGALERAGFASVFQGMDDAESFAAKIKAFHKGFKALEQSVAVGTRQVNRMEAELRKRGIENADVYAEERNLVGDASFDFGDVAFQLPFRRDGFARGELRPSQERLIEHAVGTMPQVAGVRPMDLSARLPWVSEDRYMAAFYDLLARGEDVRKLDDPTFKPEVLRQAAFHGSPHIFDRFDLSKIGTGEGAQAYGHGLYFAENEKVAQQYQPRDEQADAKIQREYDAAERRGDYESLEVWERAALHETPDAIEAHYADPENLSSPEMAKKVKAIVAKLRKIVASEQSALYRVDIPDAAVARMLDWDKPLSEQAPEVQEALEKMGIQEMLEDLPSARGPSGKLDTTGEFIYHAVVNFYEQHEGKQDAPRVASEALAEMGIPGIKYLDAGSRSAGEGSRNLVVFDDNLITITHRNGEPVTPTERTEFLKQSAPQNRPNAFIRLGVSDKTIGLMKGADLSSVMHEFAHDWLNLFGELASQENAPEDIVRDYAIILDQLGVTSREQIGEREQEQWARAFEKYLADGQAPTLAQQRLFSRFKAWMKMVYQAALSNFAPVSPELRGVFDRMFASEQAIAEAMAQTEPLIEEQGNLTDAEFAALQQAQADVRERADAQLLSTLLSETNKERREGWAERKGAIEAEVKSEVESRPVQQAVAFLRAKTTPKEGKLSKAILVSRYGPDITKTLPKGTFTVDGGIDPDLIALSVGLDSGDTLVTQLQGWEAPATVIARETERRLSQEFPDLVNDSPALADEAQKQVHAAVNDDVLMAELKALGRSDASVPAPNIKAVKRLAQEEIDSTPIRDLQPHRYLLAERKANRLAKEALRAGDIPKAAFHGRQQLLNHILYRYANRAIEMQGKALKFFGRMAKDSMREKLGLAGQEYLGAMDGLLADYEFVRLSNVALDRREALNRWLDRMREEQLPVNVPPNILADAQKRNYRTLTVSELQAVFNVGKQVHQTATHKGKLLDAKRKRDAEQVEREVVASISTHHDLQPRSRDYVPERFKSLKKVVAKFDAWHTKPEFLFRWLDGDRNGATWKNLFEPIAEAEADENRMLREMVPNLQAVFAAVPEATRKDWLKRSVMVGRTRMTGEQVFALALNWGNEGNREAILASTVDGEPEWTATDVTQALRTLTAAEWQAVQMAWDLVGSYWPEIAAMQQRLVGVAPEQVQAVPFTIQTADGQTVEMKGGYYPLAYDREYSWVQEKIEQKRDVQEMGEWGYTRAQTRHGHTEQRVGSGGKPVKLDLSVLGEHLLNVIHDLSHREAVLNTQRLIERDGIRTAMVQAAGQEMYAMLSPWLKRVASDRLPPASPVESFLGRARRGATVVNMGLKATTAIVQPLGYLQSIDYLGGKYARKGMSAFLKSPQEIWEFASESSETIKNRRESFDREARDLLKHQQGKRDWQAKVAKASMFFTGLADMSVSVPTWYGAYLKEMDASGDHERAVGAGDQAVRMTQGSGAPKDLARIQGGSEYQRIFTMFYTYFSTLYNLMRRSASNVKTASDVPRFIASMGFLWFIPAILSELFAQRGPEDDEDAAEWAAWQLARYPLASVVGVRDFASALGPDAYKYEMSPTVEAMRSLADATNAIGSATFSDDELSRNDWKEIVESVGYWGQLPTRQGWITGTYLYDFMMGYDVPDNPVEAGRNLLFARPR